MDVGKGEWKLLNRIKSFLLGGSCQALTNQRHQHSPNAHEKPNNLLIETHLVPFNPRLVHLTSLHYYPFS